MGMMALAPAGNHLKLTRSMLAKQRRKAGEEGSADEGVGRVQTIDALLLAIKRRLRAVQEAMAQDAAAAAEAAQQDKQQQAVGSPDAATGAPGESPVAECGTNSPRRSMQARPPGREQRAGSLFGMQLQQVFAEALVTQTGMGEHLT